jgi:4'-phosphopantetheinyl transferase
MDVIHPAEEAHVWTADPATVDFLDVLSPEERERMQRFVFERDRLSYMAAHGLARLALSTFVPVAPEAWDFQYDANGKPEIADSTLCFNISHTHGLVACVITTEIDCGIDVERLNRPTDFHSLAGRVLSPAERAALFGATEAAQPERFFSYWTLKEAYVKARGCGISIPLDQCSFEPRVTLVDDDPNDWQFERWSPTAQHVLAVALRSGGRRRRIVRHQSLTRSASAPPRDLQDRRTART